MRCPRALHSGYDEGNLSWLAALEAEPATDVMALLPWAKNEQTLTGPAAQVCKVELRGQLVYDMHAARLPINCSVSWQPPARQTHTRQALARSRIVQVRLRQATLTAIRKFAADTKLKEPKNILDAGCSGRGAQSERHRRFLQTSLVLSISMCPCVSAVPAF